MPYEKNKFQIAESENWLYFVFGVVSSIAPYSVHNWLLRCECYKNFSELCRSAINNFIKIIVIVLLFPCVLK